MAVKFLNQELADVKATKKKTHLLLPLGDNVVFEEINGGLHEFQYHGVFC